VTDLASTLGSDGSTIPAIFNVGTLVGGAAMAVAASGYAASLRRVGIGRVLTVLVALSLLGGAIGSVNAAIHPLPDVRHTSGALFGVGAVLFTPLVLFLLLAMWRVSSRGMRGIWC